MGLAQVGEFSFIVGDLARHHHMISDTAYNLVVACALVSISLNPLLMRSIEPFERFIRRRPTLWRWLNATAMRRSDLANADTVAAVAKTASERMAVIVGYGPVGQAVDRVLREAGASTVVIDLNMDTVAEVTSHGRLALFGDASHPDILEQAGLRRASHLVITLPHSVNRAPMVAAARQISPGCKILVRARYLRERADLAQVGANTAVFEELEAAVSLTALVLADFGSAPEKVAQETDRVRREILEAVEVL
jgi:CPA2 family monovalent cation:H+ antiporter-2